MKKIVLPPFYFLLLFCFHFSYSQIPLVKQWDYRFGGAGDDVVSDFQLLPDGGFILNGSSASGISGDRTQASQGGADCWFIKVDANGTKQWDKSFGGSGNDYQRSLIRTTDGGYISGGRSLSGISGDKTQVSQGGYDYWIVKMDSARNIKWDRSFGGTTDDYFLAMQQTLDGGYIFGGWTVGGIGGDKTQASKGSSDCWLVKVDSVGNKQWDKDYGGAGEDFLYSIMVMKDGGYLLGAWTNSGISGDKTQPTKGGYDYWIIRIDSLGNIIWDKDIGGVGDEGLSTMEPTTDGCYIIGGRSYSGINGDKTQPNRDASNNTLDYWIVKIDSLGNKKWDRDFGGTINEDDLGNIYQTMDGGYLVSGTSYSAIGGDKTESNLGTEQTWIVKTDSLGNKQWDKTLQTSSTTTHDETGLGVQTKDGCYVFANYTIGGIGGDKSVPSQGGIDYWLIKFCDTTQQCVVNASFISSDTVFCEESGKCIDFTDLSTCNPTSWNWSFPGGNPANSTQQNPSGICYYVPGSYDVTLIAGGPAGSDTLKISSLIVFGSGAAVPVITISHDTLFSSPAFSYQWYFNGLPVSGATNSFYVATQDGSYNIYITDQLGCSRLGNSVTYVSVNDILNYSGIGIYPNPAGDEFTVYSSEPTVGAKIEIFNAIGEKVYINTLNNKRQTINSKLFIPGIYFCKVMDEREIIFVGKIIIQR